MYDSDEEEENSNQEQVLCLKWIKRNNSLKFDKVCIKIKMFLFKYFILMH